MFFVSLSCFNILWAIKKILPWISLSACFLSLYLSYFSNVQRTKVFIVSTQSRKPFFIILQIFPFSLFPLFFIFFRFLHSLMCHRGNCLHYKYLSNSLIYFIYLFSYFFIDQYKIWKPENIYAVKRQLCQHKQHHRLLLYACSSTNCYWCFYWKKKIVYHWHINANFFLLFLLFHSFTRLFLSSVPSIL